MLDTANNIPEVAASDFDFLTTDQMIEVDRLMTDVLEIKLIPVSYTHLTLPTKA